MDYTYTAAGQISLITYPDTSTAFNYTYASNRRMDLIKSGATTVVDYTYTGLRPTDRDISTGSATLAGTYVYDSLGRLTQLYTMVGANTRNHFTYGLDSATNRLYRENVVTSGKDEFYMYDTLNRLTSADRGDLNVNKDGLDGAAVKYQDWDLDNLGNWDYFYDDSATAQTRLHNAVNEITKLAGSAANLGYDSAGNMTRAPKAGSYYSYEYDHLNRITLVKDSSNNDVATYAYDAFNRRIEKVGKTGESDITYSYYYGQTPSDASSWQLLEVYEDADFTNVYEQYVWGGQYIDEIIRRQRDTDTDGSFDDTLYYDQDGNWNVIALLAADGAVLERYLYDAYGDPTIIDADWSSDDNGISDYDNSILYCGYHFDTETENYHIRNRYLHPTLGRWLSCDPIGYEDGMNLYEYVRSKPILAGDPMGLLTVTQCPSSYAPFGTLTGYKYDLTIFTFCIDENTRIMVMSWRTMCAFEDGTGFANGMEWAAEEDDSCCGFGFYPADMQDLLDIKVCSGSLSWLCE